ncbi:MAG TPA: aminotransferase class IV [Rubricoccaceae bacterium]|jgi:para-aminobenzoate synthetase/4-amino-4-deoxychorismate lyase
MTPGPVTLLETMRAEAGHVALLDRHLARLAASAPVFGCAFDESQTQAVVADALARAEPAPTHRVRLTLGDRVHAEAKPLVGAPFRTVWLCPDPLREAGGLLCRHKTTRRAHYEAPYRRALAMGADEAILVSGAGEIVEGSRTSVWIRRGDAWLTPPLAAGGLPGIARAVLLASLPGACEARLTPDDLRTADALAVSNALRGLCPVSLVGAQAGAAGEPPRAAAPLSGFTPPPSRT